MKLIQQNPYRIAGLLAGSTAKQQERQVKRLGMYLEADQEPQADFSFPVLGRLNRTVESLTDAVSKLNLDKDKLHAALFWFYKGNEITDEPAFDALKADSLAEGQRIWERLVSNGQLNKRNSSAYHNLSTLLLCKCFNGASVNTILFTKGISMKIQFLESEFASDLVSLSTDEIYKPAKKDIQLLFLDSVQEELEKYGTNVNAKFLEVVNTESFSAKEEFLKRCVQKPIEQIKICIERAKSKRKANKANAAAAGDALVEEVSQELTVLKDMLGASNLTWSSIADKVSDEILQCGIDYFLHFRDSNTDPSYMSMALFKKAKTFAVGNIAIQRCNENTENLQKWIDDKPLRDKQRKIEADLDYISTKLERFQSLSDTVSNAKDLIDNCKPRLINIKNTLGATDELYLKISSTVVGNAQGMLVVSVNDEQEIFKYSLNPSSENISKIVEISARRYGSQNIITSLSFTRLIIDSHTALNNLKKVISEALLVSTSLGKLDMSGELRAQYNRNHTTLKSLANQFTKSHHPSSPSSGNCYVATMAYGHYDHPQVIELRKFRDENLEKSIAGKYIIKAYYLISPKIVKLFKNQEILNSIIRTILNQFIKLIK